MGKILFIGALPKNSTSAGGETIKNQILCDYLTEENITFDCLDTLDWKNRKNKIFFQILSKILRCNILILSTSTSSALKFLKYFSPILKSKKIKVIYFVIGGTLAETIKKKPQYLKHLKICHQIYVETNGMKKQIIKAGLINSFVVPNFKNYNFIPTKKNHDKTNPVKLFFFSRVCIEKGIEIAVSAVKELSEKHRIVFDIYGPIEKGYEAKFEDIIKGAKDISYKGILKANSNETYKILSDYDLMLFPTFHKGEGFPGAIIDSYIAGVPVLASDWKYNSEIIIPDKTGWLFDLSSKDNLENSMLDIIKTKKYYKCRSFCIEEAKKYHINELLNKLEIIKDFQ